MNRFLNVLSAVVIIAQIAWADTLSAVQETKTEAVAGSAEKIKKFDFFTEYYFTQDANGFFGHKNTAFRNAYLVEADTKFEAMIVSFKSMLFFGLYYGNSLGMGRQSEAILFDPQETNYSLVPFFEFRYKEIYYQLGLDHSCFHQIDRDTRDVSPYWNELYIRVSSANYRFQQFKKNYILQGRDNWYDKFRWSFRAGYFGRKFGGVDPTLINGGHPFAGRMEIDLNYSFAKTKNWLFGGQHKLTCQIDTAGTSYWTGNLGLDADIYSFKHSLGFFVNYNYEFPKDLPLFSRDRLFEWGIRWRM